MNAGRLPERRRPVGARIADIVLGTDPVGRKALRRMLLAQTVYLTSLCGESLGAWFGLCDPLAVAWHTAYMVFGNVVFYALVRSGFSRRFADHWMTMPQIMFSFSSLIIGYPISGPLRGLCLLTAAVPPLFGFVTIERLRGALLIGSLPLVFGAMMLTLSIVAPARFDPRVEAQHFAILVSCMGALGVLLWQISGRHERLRTKKAELASALQDIEAMSTRDELTGLYNRRHMTARLEEEIERRARGGGAFCVCLIDIDHFKRINDTHGHAGGDLVLRRFAALLREWAGDVEIVARWGGEEFLLLMPHQPAAIAMERLEQLRQRSAAVTDWGPGALRFVRFSAGVAEDDGGSIGRVVERADRALYLAKAAGRGQVVLAAVSQTA